MPVGASWRKSVEHRFGERLWYDPETECIEWTGSLDEDGYGRFWADGRQVKAHRWAVGDIPAGLHVDHLCRTRSCVNPDHLEAVTTQVNTLRGEGPTAQNARRTHCTNGHPLSGDNLRERTDTNGRPGRSCRTCQRESGRLRRQRKRTRSSLMNLQPIGNKIVIVPDDAEEVTPGGIVIPDDAKEEPVSGIVQAVGPGDRYEDGTTRPMQTKPGNRVWYPKYGTNKVKIDEVTYLVVDERDCFGWAEVE